MKVLTFSRYYPKGHPKAGQFTFFVEKIFAGLAPSIIPDPLIIPGFIWAQFQDCRLPKHHTIRAGARFKAGDMASLRIWSDKPYRSKQLEFAQVEVKKVWSIEIWLSDQITIGLPEIAGVQLRMLPLCVVAENDGLECSDFEAWFRLHPKKKGKVFAGQIICWNDKIEYTPSPLTEKTQS